jgi:hypothetical protein
MASRNAQRLLIDTVETEPALYWPDMKVAGRRNMRRLVFTVIAVMAINLLSACGVGQAPKPVLTQDKLFSASGTLLLQKGSMVQYVSIKFVPDPVRGDAWGWYELDGNPGFQGRDGSVGDRGTKWWSYGREFEIELIFDGDFRPTEVHMWATSEWTITHIDGVVQELQTAAP